MVRDFQLQSSVVEGERLANARLFKELGVRDVERGALAWVARKAHRVAAQHRKIGDRRQSHLCALQVDDAGGLRRIVTDALTMLEDLVRREVGSVESKRCRSSRYERGLMAETCWPDGGNELQWRFGRLKVWRLLHDSRGLALSVQNVDLHGTKGWSPASATAERYRNRAADCDLVVVSSGMNDQSILG